MLIQTVSYFFLYAFLGWCLEVTYNALTRGKFINAGLVNGPWCPIYGFGVLGIIKFLEPVQDNLLYLFLGAVLIASLLELVTGLLLEKVFHHKWWDYSDRPLNLGGYICLSFSLAWGLSSVILVRYIHPLISQLVEITPHTLSVLILSVLFMLLLVDTIVTANSILKLNRKLENMEELSVRLRGTSDNIGEALASGVLILAEAREDLEEKLHETRAEIRERLDVAQYFDLDVNPADQLPEMESGDGIPSAIETDRGMEPLRSPIFGERRLIKAFPRMVSRRHEKAMLKLKEIHGENRERRNQAAVIFKAWKDRHNIKNK